MALNTMGRPIDDVHLVHLFVGYRPIVADANSVDAPMVYWWLQLHYPPPNCSIGPIANGAYSRWLAAADAIAS